ncbi:MAG TPA: sigma-70 family RNA polymerase sigma factor [Myxococcota bacterium]|nr:sigma-70 family RNA polymerase sigma factor [Myxococcota bacterium]
MSADLEDDRERQDADARDAELLDRIARGDLEAFRTIFGRFYPRVFAFLQRRLRDPSLVEDTVVEVFYEVWRSAGRFRGESRPSTFLCGIAHFKALAAVRAQGRSKRSAVIPTDQEILAQAPDPDDLVGQLESRDDMRRVRVALDGLSEGHREVVEMAFLDGLPYAEIADRLGIAEGTVKTRVARARAQLRRQLSRIDPDTSPREEP